MWKSFRNYTVYRLRIALLFCSGGIRAICSEHKVIQILNHSVDKFRRFSVIVIPPVVSGRRTDITAVVASNQRFSRSPFDQYHERRQEMLQARMVLGGVATNSVQLTKVVADDELEPGG